MKYRLNISYNLQGFILDSGMFKPFQPAWWLPSAHLQTVFPVWFRPRLHLPLEMETVDLADGDFIQLAWYARSAAPIVLIVHGLEGSVHSHYIQPLMQRLHAQGYSPVCMQLRGCGDVPNRQPYSYHSGRTQDLVEILNYLADTHRAVAALVGFSLGGNLILKYLGEQGTHSPVKAAVAVSVPFQLAQCAQRLEHGASNAYGQFLLHHLKRSYQRKFKQITSPLHVDLTRIKTLFAFDDAITAPLNGFENAADYYQQCSCIGYLEHIQRPTLVIQARDDPFMYPQTIPDASHLNEWITLHVSEYGGHVGFVAGNKPWRPHYWLDTTISDWLKKQLEL